MDVSRISKIFILEMFCSPVAILLTTFILEICTQKFLDFWWSMKFYVLENKSPYSMYVQINLFVIITSTRDGPIHWHNMYHSIMYWCIRINSASLLWVEFFLLWLSILQLKQFREQIKATCISICPKTN